MGRIRIYNRNHLIKKVFEKLLEQNLTISFAESMTGGMLSSLLVKNAGASKVFIGSKITYQTEEKTSQLGVSRRLINRYGVVSSQVSEEMAKGLKKAINADISVSITGSAGPTTINEDKKEAYFTIMYNEVVNNYHIQLRSNSRKRNIKRAVKEVYFEIYKLIK